MAGRYYGFGLLGELRGLENKGTDEIDQLHVRKSARRGVVWIICNDNQSSIVQRCRDRNTSEYTDLYKISSQRIRKNFSFFLVLQGEIYLLRAPDLYMLSHEDYYNMKYILKDIKNNSQIYIRYMSSLILCHQ